MTEFFARNEHRVDRLLRVLLGLTLLSFFIVDQGAWWGLIGIVPLATGIVGTCPLYSLLGFSTCSRERGC